MYFSFYKKLTVLANFSIVINCWHCTDDRERNRSESELQHQKRTCGNNNSLLIHGGAWNCPTTEIMPERHTADTRGCSVPKVWIFWKYKSSSTCLQIRVLTLGRMKSQRIKRHKVLGYIKISITLNTYILPALCCSASTDWRWTEGTPIMRLTSGRIRTRIYNICIPFQLIFNLFFYNFLKIWYPQIWCYSWLS